MDVDEIVSRWAEQQAKLGNPCAPKTLADLNMLGPARERSGVALRAVIVAELFLLCIDQIQVPSTRDADGVWRLRPDEHMRLRRVLAELVQDLRFGLLFDVVCELPVNPDGTPQNEVRLAVASVLPILQGVPRASA